MAAPVFVNAGVVGHGGNVASVSPGLPASRVNGNLLIAIVEEQTAGTASTFTIAGTGWVGPFDSQASGTVSSALFYCIVNGSEGAPTITIHNTGTGLAETASQIFQYSGVVSGYVPSVFSHLLSTTNSPITGTSITTTANNSLIAVLVGGDSSTDTLGAATNYTQDSAGAGGTDGTVGAYSQTKATAGTASDAFSATTTGAGGARFAVYEIEINSIASAPAVTSTIATTLPKLTQLLNGLSFIPILATLAATEAKDIFNGAARVPTIGAWLSTEVQDLFGFAGFPTPALGVDVRATGGASGTSSVGTTSATVTITTGFKDDIIVLGILSGGFWHQGKVLSVTDTAGLFWQRRNQRQVVQSHLNGTTDSWVEEWWAHKTLAGATTITVTTDPTGAIAIEAVAVAGANFNKPFDTHTGAAMIIDNYNGDVIDVAGRGHIGNPATLLYTDSAQSLTLAFHASPDTNADTTVPAGFTFLGRSEHDEGSGNTEFVASMYKVENTQQFGTTDVWFGPDGTHITNRYMIVESIIGKDQTAGTPNIIRWYFDGNGNRTIEQFTAGQNSTAMNVVTFRENAIVVVAVMSLTGANSRVDHISDDGNHSGWTRRSIVTDSSGAVCMETWWVEMSNKFSGNVTVTMDSAIQTGDYVSAITFAVHGADLFQRGEIWDTNGSLPAVNHGNSTGGHQTVGPFSTSNDNVLVLAFGANIDATTNDTDPTGKNLLPFLQLPAPGELVSDGPPSFHIALDYKFSEPVVTGVSTELDVSPAPQSWLMIADAIAVGPVSPPHGALIVTEPKDVTRHNGDFTAIGIASPGGWFGYVPNHLTLGAVETKDHTANSGAFTALWAKEAGWVGCVPAFLSMHPIERIDAMLYRAWVLGPRTIIGHMHPTEAPDRLNFSGLHTYYTTADSFGDRTARITVTTNATLTSGTVDNLVDGVKANGAANAITVANTQPAGMFFTFDFHTAKVINEAKWYQNGTFVQPGAWRWRGSQDNATWTILSAADFTLDGGNLGTVIGNIAANQTAYRYYQLIQTTNAGGTDIPQLWEIEFKVAGFGAVMAAAESKDRFAGNMLAIPTATPIPARKRRMLIVT